jgi:hypothetical protein
MDPYTFSLQDIWPLPTTLDDPEQARPYQNHPSQSEWPLIRRSMGYTRRYAQKVNLVAMVPRGDLASSGYCLANPGVEYLVYLPATKVRAGSLLSGWFKEKVTVDLSAIHGKATVEWFIPTTEKILVRGAIIGGSKREFTAPTGGDAVLYLAAS